MEKLPILFLIFSREDAALAALESIRSYQPSKLYIAADGARNSKENEFELCKQTRQSILSKIDWECKVQTLFRDENLGCAKAVSSAIDWFFDKEEYGVIIEDDVVLSRDFFSLCEIVLPYYADCDDVMLITAQNFTHKKLLESDKLFFTNVALIWGWASWRRAWQRMDMSMSRWNKTSYFSILKHFGLPKGVGMIYYWSKLMKDLQNSSSWATRWNFAVFSYKGLCLSSPVNLVKNCGVNSGNGTHYNIDDRDIYKNINIGKVIFPLKYPKKQKVTFSQNILESMEFLRQRFYGLEKKMKR